MTRRQETLARRLKAGLIEGIKHARGELTLRTIQFPTPAPRLTPRHVIALRRRCGMSQAVFARVINVSLKTIQSWEQGLREPSDAALRVLHLLDRNPRAVYEAVGVPSGNR